MRYTWKLTLSSVVVDVRVVGVVSDSGFKVAECSRLVVCCELGFRYPGVARTKLHVHRGNLDPSLGELRPDVKRLLQVNLRTLAVANEESSVSSSRLYGSGSSLESTPHGVRLGLALLPRDALLDRLLAELVGVRVVRSGDGVERQAERLVTLRRVLRESGLGV